MGGVDKPLLTIGGTTILARIRAAMALPDVAVSANGDPARYGPVVLPDGAFAGAGPLAGLLAGLEWAHGICASALLTVPGDTPFVPPDLARTLAPAPACAASTGRAHYLVALWPVAARTALRAHLSVPGPRRVGHFAAMIGMRRVDFPPMAWDPFLNVNTPEDLELARSLAERP